MAEMKTAHLKKGHEWLLSQHLFGWPAFRPRMYTILVKRTSGKLEGAATSTIHKLYRKPKCNVAALLVAPRVS